MKDMILPRPKIFLLAILTLFLFLSFTFTAPAHAAVDWGTVSGCTESGVATIKGLECAFSNFVSVILAFAGIVLFIMFVVGGFRYLTSGGDPKAIEAAKGTLTQAIVGLVILVLAFLILKLIETITNVPVTQFKVTQ